MPLPPEEVPDYGNLRDDVCGVLQSMNQNNIEVMMKKNERRYAAINSP